MPNVILEKLDSTAISLDQIATDKINNLGTTKLVDGSLSYPKKHRESTNWVVTIRARDYIRGDLYSIEQFEEISSQIFKDFDKLCNEILSDNIELAFFLAPYHPIVYEKIKNEYQIVLEVESELLEYAKQNKIEFIGSFSPIKTDIDSLGFYDGMHGKENTIKKVMKVRTDNNTYKSLGDW